jgi:hypothetical protein
VDLGLTDAAEIVPGTSTAQATANPPIVVDSAPMNTAIALLSASTSHDSTQSDEQRAHTQAIVEHRLMARDHALAVYSPWISIASEGRKNFTRLRTAFASGRRVGVEADTNKLRLLEKGSYRDDKGDIVSTLAALADKDEPTTHETAFADLSSDLEHASLRRSFYLRRRHSPVS